MSATKKKMQGLWVKNAILQNPKLSANAKLVYAYLDMVAKARKGNKFNVTNPCLAKALGISAKTVSRAINSLKKADKIIVLEQDKRYISLRQNVEDGQNVQDKLSNKGGQNVLIYNNTYNNTTHTNKVNSNFDSTSSVDISCPSLEKFVTSFESDEQATINLEWYYIRVTNWARSEGKVIYDYAARARLFMQGDKEKGKLRLIQSTKKENDASRKIHTKTGPSNRNETLARVANRLIKKNCAATSSQ